MFNIGDNLIFLLTTTWSSITDFGHLFREQPNYLDVDHCVSVYFDLNIIYFIVNFVHQFFYFVSFSIFYRRINIPYIHKHTYITDISGFKNRLNHLFSSTGLYFKSQFGNILMKLKILFLNLWALFLKMSILKVATFFLA